MPCRSEPFRSVTSPFKPFRTTPSLSAPRFSVQFRASSCPVVQFRALSFRSKPFRSVPSVFGLSNPFRAFLHDSEPFIYGPAFPFSAFPCGSEPLRAQFRAFLFGFKPFPGTSVASYPSVHTFAIPLAWRLFI